MENNLIEEKSRAFALRTIRLYQYLCETKKEYVLSKQLLRCGTSIGANVQEGRQCTKQGRFFCENVYCL